MEQNIFTKKKKIMTVKHEM